MVKDAEVRDSEC